MYYYLYEIRNKLNGKIYIGVHQTSNIDDKYMGSGKVLKQAIKKHGIVNFSKTILEYFSDEESMYAREKELVTEEFLARPDVYNLSRGGGGGFGFINSHRDCDYHAVRSRNGKANSSNLMPGRDPGVLASEISKKAAITRISNGNGFDVFRGRTHTTKTKQQIGNTNAEKQKGKNNSQFGTCWIHNNIRQESKKIPKQELPAWVSIGWLPGRRINW